jgi:hypothetical protein
LRVEAKRNLLDQIKEAGMNTEDIEKEAESWVRDNLKYYLVLTSVRDQLVEVSVDHLFLKELKHHMLEWVAER